MGGCSAELGFQQSDGGCKVKIIERLVKRHALLAGEAASQTLQGLFVDLAALQHGDQLLNQAITRCRIQRLAGDTGLGRRGNRRRSAALQGTGVQRLAQRFGIVLARGQLGLQFAGKQAQRLQ